MENFFNYITKPLTPEDVDVWFRSNNIIPEKLVLYYDFTRSLNMLIVKTYLGETDNTIETKITLSDEDNGNHFIWCWNRTLENFKKESINFYPEGEHLDYFKSFFDDTFYNQKNEEIRNAINDFFTDLFDTKKPFTKSDLDMISSLYKVLDKNIDK
jgi:hypothetical protein